jgi:hypothetical protein
MNFFLLEFDRSKGKLVALKRFPAGQRQRALDARLAMQKKVLEEGKNCDVVLLEADSEAALRETHASFFLTRAQLVARIAG